MARIRGQRVPRKRAFRVNKNPGLKTCWTRGAREDDKLVGGFVSDIVDGGKAACQEDLRGLGPCGFFLLIVVGGEDRVEKLRDVSCQRRIPRSERARSDASRNGKVMTASTTGLRRRQHRRSSVAVSQKHAVRCSCYQQNRFVKSRSSVMPSFVIQKCVSSKCQADFSDAVTRATRSPLNSMCTFRPPTSYHETGALP
jgi:hypothetical protein